MVSFSSSNEDDEEEEEDEMDDEADIKLSAAQTLMEDQQTLRRIERILYKQDEKWLSILSLSGN